MGQKLKLNIFCTIKYFQYQKKVVFSKESWQLIFEFEKSGKQQQGFNLEEGLILAQMHFFLQFLQKEEGKNVLF